MPELIRPVRAAFTHGMDVMLVCTAVVTAISAVLAARFLPAHADDAHVHDVQGSDVQDNKHAVDALAEERGGVRTAPEATMES